MTNNGKLSPRRPERGPHRKAEPILADVSACKEKLGAGPGGARSILSASKGRYDSVLGNHQNSNANTGAAFQLFLACKPHQRLCLANGFTLIEILIVVVILGIATVVASANLFQTDEEKLQQESERMLAVLQIARDEAAFGGRVIAVDIALREMRFLERDLADATRWQLSSIAPLSTRRLSDNLEIELKIGASGADANVTRIVFLPIGVAAPFEIALRSQAGARRISGDAIGNLRLTKG